MSYNVKFTDKNKLPIEIAENTINVDNDVTLFGRKKLEYGEDLNANLLHILENFACDEEVGNPGVPDTTTTSTIADTAKKLLTTPVQGQLWWNKTQNCMFSWDGTEWVAMSMKGDIAVNWGTLCDGEQIPKPVSASGYIFDYSECVWIVSPKFTSGNFEYVLCYTDENAVVTMQYGIEGGATRQGVASFMIVGLKGNFNLGSIVPITPPDPEPTPSPTPAVTPTRTSTPAVVPVSPVPVSPSPTSTPDVTTTRTPTPTPTQGSSVTPTPTGTPAPTLTPTPTGTPASTPAVTATPTGTPPPTPTPSAEAQSGALIPFGDQEIGRYNNNGYASTGIAFNGFTNEFAPAQEHTRYNWRLETAAFDVAEGPYVDMGATVGNEPASWADEYWVYITGSVPPDGLYVEWGVGNVPLNTWVNIGGGASFFVGLTTNPTGPAPAEQDYNITVYMQRSVSQPVGTGSATLMGTLDVTVSANDIP